MPAIPPNRKPFDLFGPGPTSRMTMLPFGTYADESGREHLDFAWPSMISEPINAMGRLAENSRLPDGRLGIPNPDNAQNQQDVLTGLLALYGGNTLKGLSEARPALTAQASVMETPSLGQPTQAASYYNGELFTGLNHGDAYNQAVAKYGEAAVDQMLLRDGMQDGFVDHAGNFMDRITANELSGGKGLNAYELLPRTYASGGNVPEPSGLSGLRTLPDYGFGPMTPTTIAGRPNGYISATETPEERLRGIADTGAFPVLLRGEANQINAMTSGIGDAVRDPSLANITNAGVQSGLAMMSPTLTAVFGLGGLGLAALQDANLIPSAEAKRLRKPAPAPALVATPAPEPVDPVFDKIKDDPSLVALYQQIKVEQNNATRDYPGRNGDASRAEAAGRVTKLQNDFATALANRDAAKQGIYDQQVLNANAARDVELARDRRFSDTEVGKVYDKLGGYAPLVAGVVPGLFSRLAYGPAATVGKSLLRDAEGVTFGIGANNVPLAYNAFATEVDNPEQRAYAAYGYNLPDNHPDKAKALAMAESLPKLNPVRQGAAEELYDKEKFAERALMGGFEGWGGNRLGQMLSGGLGGLFRRSSYQLPPEPAVAVTRASGQVSPVPPGAPAKLLADKQVALPESSGPIGPASSRSLPVLGDAADTVPVSPVPRRKPSGGRRSKSGGSKGSPETSKSVSSSGPPADTSAAASDELKRFFGAKQAPTPDDLKAAGGAVHGRGEGGKSVSGPLHAATGGRTDVLPIDVAAGSYVVPADIVSALGEGNTSAGTQVLQEMFPAQTPSLHYASGGKVPIIAAGGEHILSPDQVATVGGGDLNHGHSILDQWVRNTRNETIKTLQSLPGPQT